MREEYDDGKYLSDKVVLNPFVKLLKP